jgi:hypothetical protein
MDRWIGGGEASSNALGLWSCFFACIAVLFLCDARPGPRILPGSLPMFCVTMQVRSQSLLGRRRDRLQTPHHAPSTPVAGSPAAPPRRALLSRGAKSPTKGMKFVHKVGRRTVPPEPAWRITAHDSHGRKKPSVYMSAELRDTFMAACRCYGF